MPRIKSRKWRLIQEVHYATYKALEIRDAIGDRELEIHLDYNESDKHKSNSVVKESIGFVLGQGFDYKLKPHAPAASSAADRLGKNNLKLRKRSRNQP